MNRVDRLLAIILELQAKRHQRAEDLATTLETSKRTIYRDMQALAEIGVPVISTPGQGFSLMEGYFLPPLSLTSDEAAILLLGARMMEQSFDPEYGMAAQFAARKIESILPGERREKVDALRTSFLFVPGGGRNREAESGHIRLLRTAIMRSQTVRFHYHARDSAEGEAHDSVREVDPYALVYVMESWLLVGYCHMRKAKRSFRLVRMANLTLLPKTFQRPADTIKLIRGTDPSELELEVQLLFDPSVARWVEEDRFFYVVKRQHIQDGLLVTLRVRKLQDAVSWILRWGGAVQVLEPADLRDMVIAEAERLIEKQKLPESLLP